MDEEQEQTGAAPEQDEYDEECDEGCDEEDDIVPPLNAEPFGMQILRQLMEAKSGDPSHFASYWEMDEQDVEEATEEEIQNDPAKRTLWAAENGNIEVLTEMLEKDASLVSVRDSDGYTPLHRASYYDHTEAVKLLLKRGADVNAKTEDNWTPLHSACNWACTKAASLLMQNGACVNAVTKGKQTPLHLAAANREAKDVLEMLLMNKLTDTSIQNGAGDTAEDICKRSSALCALFEMREDSVNKLYDDKQ